MHHDIQKIISYHNFYLFFPICKWKEFKLFQLLESFKKNVLMHRPSIKKSLYYVRHGKIKGQWALKKPKSGRLFHHVWHSPHECDTILNAPKLNKMPKGGINGRKRNFGKLNTPMGDFDWLGAQSNYRVKYFAKIMQKVLKKLCKKDTVMHCTLIYT